MLLVTCTPTVPDGLKTKDALSKMVEDQILMGPPIWRVPSEMVVGPVNWELFPVRIVVPAPAWFNDPLPIMVEVMVVVLV